MDLSLIISILALLVSVALGVLRLVEFNRDKVKVSLKCEADQLIVARGGSSPYKDGVKYICVTVMNRGRRPVTIQNVAYVLADTKEKYGIFADSLLNTLKELTEGKAAQYFVEQDKVPLDKIKYFIAIDSIGRKYKGKLKLK